MPQLHILSGKRQGESFELQPGGEVDIGNRKSARLSIRDPWVSYNHARIVCESGRFVIEDQDSSNGTWLDAPSGPRRIKRHELTPNDVFALGKTRIKFVADAPAPTTASFGSAPGQTMRLSGGDQPWWDRGVQTSEQARPGATGAASSAAAGGGSLEQELREERKMREVLERFFELPPGTPVADAARAGALEREVQELKRKLERAGGRSGGAEDVDRLVNERTEKLRQELVTKRVELEGRATAAEAKAVDLERRLLDKAEQTKKEVARAREKAQAELEELKQALEEARASNRELASGGDAALESARQRGDKLEAELEQWRDKARQLEEVAETLGRELSDATAAASRPDEGLQARLDEALAEAERWKGEHQAVIQEIDDISMEQIEIEDALKARIKELERQLAELGATPAPAAALTAKSGAKTSSAPVSKGPVVVRAAAEPARPASDIATYDSASLGVLPRSELGSPPAMDDADMEGSADLTSSSETSPDDYS